MAKNTDLARILAIIGGLVIVVEGVLGMLGNYYTKVVNLAFLNALGAIIFGIIAIIIGLLVLISTGTLKSKKTNIGFNGATMLVLGILGIIFASTIGGILVIIAGILMLI